MDSTEYTSILIIDDEIVNLMLFTQYLQKNDFEIIEATTGEKALDILKFSVPDLILLDLGLPGMDGFEVCKIIRQEYSALTLPIIIVTAQEESNVRLQGLQSGANDFIVKPFNAEELLARINIHLDSKKSHQQLEKYHQQLMISHDELEQRVSERTLELLLAKDQAIQANHEKSLFLAKMSHELRTPLNAIIGYSEILLEELDEPDQSDNKTDANHIKKAGTRLLLLINDILDLSKIESGDMDLIITTASISDIVESVKEMSQPLMSENKNSFNCINNATIKMIDCDQVRLSQCLMNLLTNATRFTQCGKIDLASYNDEQTLFFSIKDTGIGIPETEIGKVFQSFSTLDESSCTYLGGSGMGLSISRHLCRLMGGDISFTSQQNEGSEFIISIPLSSTK